jgi:hypothetical protein
VAKPATQLRKHLFDRAKERNITMEDLFGSKAQRGACPRRHTKKNSRDCGGAAAHRFARVY